MTDIEDARADIGELRRLAEAAAVPGRWVIWRDLDHQGFKTVGDAESYEEILRDGEAEDSNPVAHVYTDADAEFIAAANPTAVLALISEIERLTAPPTDDEREALAQILLAWRGPWLDEHRPPLIDLLTQAGFRRQGPITDTVIEAASEAFGGISTPKWSDAADWEKEEVRDGMWRALEAAERAR